MKEPFEYTVEPTTQIDDASIEACRMAAITSSPVWFDFNGTRVDVEPGAPPEDVINQYFSKHAARTISETESLRAEVESLRKEIADMHKRRQAIVAAQAYQDFAKDHALEIAYEAVTATKDKDMENYPITEKFRNLLSERDRLMKEITF
jgi:cell fate (sporulation/competence/biofilm development) regulator YmcA (YheA/YmcA/DUF963 family)